MPNLLIHNLNDADVMLCGVTHAANPNDVTHMCDIHVLAGQVFLCNTSAP